MDFESCREEEEEAGRAAAWHWVWRHICRERPDTGKRLNLLVSSTVLFSRGEPTLWVFTSKSGEVMRRMSDKLKPHIVRDQLAALSHAEPSNRRRYAGVLRSTYPDGAPGQTKARVLDGAGLTDVTAKASASCVAVQQYVHARAGGGSRFRCEAVRTAGKSAQMRYRVFKL